MCNQVLQEQFVAGEMTQNTVDNDLVQEQAIVQEHPELQVMERIRTNCGHYPFGDTALFRYCCGASAPQAVVLLPPFEEFTAPVFNQVHPE